MTDSVRISHLDISTPAARSAIALHAKVFDDEFIARLGLRFLRQYYRAFAESPYAVALIATDASGQLLGGLLGTLDPRNHYRLLTRRYGVGLFFAVLLQAMTHPKLARLLVRTRLKRYVLGVLRQFRGKMNRGNSSHGDEMDSLASAVEQKGAEPRVGDITHLFVDPNSRSLGVGSRLVHAYEETAAWAGVERIDLVTLPDEQGGAGRFYRQLGWNFEEARQSRSGEQFHLYHKRIQAKD